MIVNLSQALLYHKCPKRWYNRYVLRRERDLPSPALTLGTAVHTYFEHLLDGGGRDFLMELFWKTIEGECERLKPEFPDRASRLRNGARVLAPVMMAWQDRFEGVVTLGTEEELRMPLGRHTLIGRLDRRVLWNDEQYHYQHRTLDIGVPLDTYMRAARINGHELLYKALIEHHTPGIRAGGSIMNILRKARSVAVAVARPQDLNRQFVVTLQDGDVEDLLADLVEDADAMERIVSGEARPRMNRGSCLEMFGRMPCPYLDACLGTHRIDSDRYVTVPDDYTNTPFIEEPE